MEHNKTLNPTFLLKASKFDNMEGFYTHIYALMDWQEDWIPAHNLDALNDVLYSGFSTGPVTLIWEDAAKSQRELGVSATQHFYQAKINQGEPYNTSWAQQQLAALLSGEGQTLYDIIVEIITSHKNIQLVLT